MINGTISSPTLLYTVLTSKKLWEKKSGVESWEMNFFDINKLSNEVVDNIFHTQVTNGEVSYTVD